MQPEESAIVAIDRRAAVKGLALLGLAAGLTACAKPAPAFVATPSRRRFENKVVIVTGATSGIGRAAAKAFAAEGAKVGFCGRRENLGQEVAREIQAAGGEAFYLRADVRIEAEVRDFVEGVVQKYGRLDAALNNAGITLEKPLHEFTAAEWDDVQTTNLRGVFFAMKYEIPHLIAAGGGSIVVTSSSNALSTRERRSAYAASKRGLVGLVEAAAFDYADQHIRVNALVPGTTDTALVRRVAGTEKLPDAVWELGARQWARTNIPGAKRMATPEEIAAFALVLASDEHPFMTGAQMVIDGGKSAYGG